jgi:hypothetical protein
VTIAAAEFSGRGAIRGETIRYDYFWKNALVLQEFSQQSQGSSRIASLLNQHIQHLAFVIDGSPQPHPLAVDPKRRHAFRRQFIDIAKQMEPLDLAVLVKIRDIGATAVDPTRAVTFATQLQVPTDHVVNSMAALLRLGLKEDQPNLNRREFPIISALGRQFLAATAP